MSNQDPLVPRRTVILILQDLAKHNVAKSLLVLHFERLPVARLCRTAQSWMEEFRMAGSFVEVFECLPRPACGGVDSVAVGWMTLSIIGSSSLSLSKTGHTDLHRCSQILLLILVAVEVHCWLDEEIAESPSGAYWLSGLVSSCS